MKHLIFRVALAALAVLPLVRAGVALACGDGGAE